MIHRWPFHIESSAGRPSVNGRGCNLAHHDRYEPPFGDELIPHYLINPFCHCWWRRRATKQHQQPNRFDSKWIARLKFGPVDFFSVAHRRWIRGNWLERAEKSLEHRHRRLQIPRRGSKLFVHLPCRISLKSKWNPHCNAAHSWRIPNTENPAASAKRHRWKCTNQQKSTTCTKWINWTRCRRISSCRLNELRYTRRKNIVDARHSWQHCQLHYLS